jgi:hypothetical protein
MIYLCINRNLQLVFISISHWQPSCKNTRFIYQPFNMTKRTKKTILYTILLLAIAGGITGYLMWNKPHRDIKDAEGIKITAVDLYTAFTSDSLKAKSTYTAKIVEASGEVAKSSTNQQNQVIIMLKTNTDDAYVNCTMEGKADNIKAGSKIVIKGECSGYNGGDAEMGIAGDVILVRCYVVQ